MSLEVTVPQDVQDTVDLAEKLHEQMFPQGTPEPQEPTPEPEAPQPEPEVIDPPDEELTYKARYEALQGKYNKEVPRLAADIRELKASLSQQAPAPEPEAPANDYSERIEKLRAEYGDDLVQDFKALIMQEVLSVVKPIEERTASITETQEQVAQREFIAKVSEASPKGWDNLWDSYVMSVNGEEPLDNKFIEFLDSTEPNGLYTYREILEKANNNWDAGKLGKVFSIYTNTNQAPTPEQPTVITPRPADPSQQAMVAPSRVTTQPTPQADDARIWSAKDILQFQADDRSGKYDDETSAAIWEDLMLAPSQNRIRG